LLIPARMKHACAAAHIAAHSAAPGLLVARAATVGEEIRLCAPMTSWFFFVEFVRFVDDVVFAWTYAIPSGAGCSPLGRCFHRRWAQKYCSGQSRTACSRAAVYSCVIQRSGSFLSAHSCG